MWTDPTKVMMTSLIQVTYGVPELAEDVYKYQAFGRFILTIKQEGKEVSLRRETFPKNEVKKCFVGKVGSPP